MNGIININKPPFMTSNGVTVYLRKLLNEKKVGHAGTLDPGAGGVLVTLFGRSTRILDLVQSETKEYIAELTFGLTTDTLDSYGEIIERKEPSAISEQRLIEAISQFVGEIEQIPPIYSAIKINGRKAYEYARQGIDIELKKRRIQIYDISIIERTGKNSFLLKVSCSKGTYIRTLLSDIALSMGEVGYTSLLLRSKSGLFDINDGYTPDEIKQMVADNDYSFLMTPEQVLERMMPKIYLPAKQEFGIRNGQKLYSDRAIENGSSVMLYCNNRFYGVGEKTEDALKLKIPLYDID